MMHRDIKNSLDEDFKALGLLADGKKVLKEEEDADKVAPAAEKDMKKEDEKEEKKEKKHAEPDGDEMTPEAKLESALEVVKEYFKLDENHEGLVAEDYRAIINAFAVVLESALNSGEPTKKPAELPGGDDNKMFPAGMDPNKQKPAGPLAPKKANIKYGAAKTGEVPTDYQRQGEVKTESLDALVAELKGIQASISESASDKTAETLFEGFEAIRASAAEVASRIGSDLEESENVSDEDPRVTAGNFFASIAEDAEDHLKKLAEGNVDLEVVAKNLEILGGDLKNGLSSLENVS